MNVIKISPFLLAKQYGLTPKHVREALSTAARAFVVCAKCRATIKEHQAILVAAGVFDDIEVDGYEQWCEPCFDKAMEN